MVQLSEEEVATIRRMCESVNLPGGRYDALRMTIILAETPAL